MSRHAVSALLFATVAWSTLFLVGKPMLASIDPLTLTASRYLLAGLVLAVLVSWRGEQPGQKLRRHWMSLSLLGFAGYGCFSTLTLLGLRYTLPSHGAVLMATMPLTTLGVRWLLDGERPRASAFAAAALALLGVSLVSGLASLVLGGAAVSSAALFGDALIWFATLFWIGYTRGASRLNGFSPLEFTALSTIASLPWLLAVTALAFAMHWISVPVSTLEAQLPRIAYLAATPTVAAVLAYNHGLRQLGAARSTLFLNFVPVSALALSALQGHLPTLMELGGTALVILGLCLGAGSMVRAQNGRSALRSSPGPCTSLSAS